ncbi:hypothetical protein PV327_011282 [Microctonus hyperodae]|uniref:Uncharacterized protein n=1 Tax=Microctonus hyperodae TaxID=165561 RepID=A0AA39C3M1_MICHY|nr:hypothetical protein PV327_011282 [Microctonus hyperodae]
MDFTKHNEILQKDCFQPKKIVRGIEHQNMIMHYIVKTKIGDRIVITIDDQYSVFLPERIAKFFLNDGEQFLQMAKAVKKHDLVIYYIGGKYSACEFQSKKKLLSTE